MSYQGRSLTRVAPAPGDSFVCQPKRGRVVSASSIRSNPTVNHTDDRSRAVQAYPGDPAGTCRCDIETETGPAGPIVVLRVFGEIDMLTRPLVRTALSTATDQAHGDLVLDLAGVSFCCVRGFELLVDLADTARAAGIHFALSGLSAHLDRVITMLWPDEPAVRYRSVAAAVTAIRIDQTYRLN
ncbi:STAS domain-containing protein [Pseudonocardia xinjiangensis]|uniref:STAS domain-containing protein n=1 Tax=Pseudonocardia xinjiangensis TaxID=75289 RepID=A0ABX1RBJ0_9PSEU|nr:STAS domain-containing protein [Pseudonocardia xinjiangensis]NMH76568.1 STAS domain-containing protein [Pseudonocardia xinjiangensis]